MELDVKHDKGSRFYINFSTSDASLEYKKDGDVLNIHHTFVPTDQRGKKVGEQLILAAIEYAKNEKLLLRPLCSYVQAYFKRHQEYRDILS